MVVESSPVTQASPVTPAAPAARGRRPARGDPVVDRALAVLAAIVPARDVDLLRLEPALRAAARGTSRRLGAPTPPPRLPDWGR